MAKKRKMSKQGASVKDIPAQKFVTALAAHFKNQNKVEVPAWHDLVKTGPGRELAPQDADWYYVRLAAVARRVYLSGGVGVGSLARRFGGGAKFGVRNPHHQDASRSPIRHALAQLEKLKLVAKKPSSKGRFITADGRRQLDTVAKAVADFKPNFGLALTPKN